MSRPRTNRIIEGLVATLLLSGLAIAAPVVNAAGSPPRTIFLTLPANLATPTVSLSASPSPSEGLRLVIDTTGFQFSEVCVPQADATPIGHAHVFVNGVKVASTYGPVIDIAPLPSGRNVVEVVLRGQDHRALAGPQGLIKAGLRLEI
ncbi:hypothetical protein OCH239_18615 [Roseivivax halodurans JCM 10272]|uniref:Uncharacterized protein n=1 Tax=Roseivivax halodurans JCM 10272 TaxID=1449350 RepID=X7E7I7_9RHOB|nr:hypothetical protein [Roseivivax halodurans]ETX12029.1 hypothetical protein OCH239_18615 [Roseivivax halodurans JCM 10272]